MAADSGITLPFVEDFVRIAVVDSTNTYAKSLRRYPARGVSVIVADRQSAGRGQKGNRFFSNVEGGLWMTVVCPLDDLSSHFRYNRAMIMAVYDAVAGDDAADYGAGAAAVRHAPLAIKWPNDLYWGDRKMCGMLLEAAPGNAHLLIGVGVNVNIPRESFPPKLRQTATSVLIETGRPRDLRLLLESLLRAFHRNLAIGEDTLHAAYRRRLYRVGARVEVGGVAGALQDVLIDGRLCVNANGRMQYISSGPLRFLSDGFER